MKNAKKTQSGFTLFDLVAAIVTLGMLAELALPKYTQRANDAKTAGSVTVKVTPIPSYHRT